jgi:hypothetical protein
MNKETLSDKEWETIPQSGLREKVFFKKDVKEFIKELKEEMFNHITKNGQFDVEEFEKKIDKLAGEQLK